MPVGSSFFRALTYSIYFPSLSGTENRFPGFVEKRQEFSISAQRREIHTILYENEGIQLMEWILEEYQQKIIWNSIENQSFHFATPQIKSVPGGYIHP